MWESENEIMNRRKIMSHLKTVRQFLTEEDGMGTVGLVVIFKEKITDIVNSIFTKITNQTKKI